jgi:uncharacterized membrane protein
LPARKREPETWWTDIEPASTSGGHITPAEASGPLLGPLPETDEGTGPERSGDEDGDSRPERTEVIPRGSLRAADGVATDAGGRRDRKREARPTIRRVRRSLRHIDPLSVLKLSLFLYGCFLVLWLVFVAVVYGVVSSIGVFDAVESLGTASALWGPLDITLGLVERWAFIVGLTLAILGSLINVFLAFLYNLAADVVGGAEMTFVERDL